MFVALLVRNANRDGIFFLAANAAAVPPHPFRQRIRKPAPWAIRLLCHTCALSHLPRDSNCTNEEAEKLVRLISQAELLRMLLSEAHLGTWGDPFLFAPSPFPFPLWHA